MPKRAGADPLTRLSTTYRSSANFGGSLDVSRRFGPDKAFGMRFNGAADDGRTGIDSQSSSGCSAPSRSTTPASACACRWTLMPTASGSATAARGWPPSPARDPHRAKAGTSILRGTHGEIDNMAVVGRGEFDLSDDWTVYGGVGTLSHRYAGFLNGTRANGVKPSGDYTGYTYNQRGFTDTLSAGPACAAPRAPASRAPHGARLQFPEPAHGTLNKSSGAYLSTSTSRSLRRWRPTPAARRRPRTAR